MYPIVAFVVIVSMLDYSETTSSSEQTSVDCAGTLLPLMMSVCDVCAEIYLVDNEVLRTECRSNCFRNDQFRACMTLLVPSRKTTRTSKITRRHLRKRNILRLHQKISVANTTIANGN